jgi:iron complex transport system ATP-binding protein
VIVRTEKLIVRYGATLAVDGVDITATPGSILGIIGPNGSGKSSLVKAIAGVVRARGDVLFDDSRARPNGIGYMPQDIGGNAALTVMEVVLLGRLGRLGLRVGPYELQAVSAILSDLDIAPLASRYLGELSGGQRQMVFLARRLRRNLRCCCSMSRSARSIFATNSRCWSASSSSRVSEASPPFVCCMT